MKFQPDITCRFQKLSLVFAMCLFKAVSGYSLSVSGYVFFDSNGDGIQQVDEFGINRVSVSDGIEVVQTSKNGEYHIDTEQGRILFVSLPKGYRTSGKFYTVVEKAGEINFAMQKWDESTKDSFRFVQITDIHVGGEEHNVSTFIEDIQEINSSYPKPAFVLATGDLVKDGTNSNEFENYIRALSHFQIPIFNLPGNHDLHKRILTNYHHFLGPDYYSFNFGSFHFVLLNSQEITPEQRAWLEKDISVLPKETSIIFAFHYLPSADENELLVKYKALAVFTGHWHGNRVCVKHGVLDVNTPSLRFGGIDRSPRGFRLVEIDNGKLMNTDLRIGGFNHHTEIVAPQGQVSASDKILPVVVNAYDTRFEIKSVRCEISGHSFLLKRQGSLSWQGEFHLPAFFLGEHKITIFVEGVNGDQWQKEAVFSVVDHQLIGTPLSLNWISSINGIIGFSSPRIGENCIAIGVNDKGDLQNCGVAKFSKGGKHLWHYHTDSDVKNNIAIADGFVYATSVAGWLYALDEKSGKLLWKADLDSEVKDRWEIASTTIGGGMVYAGAHSYIAAFNASDGKLIWKIRQYKDDWRPTSYSVPVFIKDKLVITDRTYAGVMNAQTGQFIWKKEGVFYGCKVVNDTIFTIGDGIPMAMSLSTGQVFWRGKEKLGSTPSSPAVAKGKMVVGTSDGRVCAFSEKDGSLLWTAQTGETLVSTQPYERFSGDINGSPAIFNQSVYIGAGDGKIHVFSLKDGKELSNYNLGSPILSTPLISGNTLYIGAYDGNLYSFSISNSD